MADGSNILAIVQAVDLEVIVSQVVEFDFDSGLRLAEDDVTVTDSLVISPVRGIGSADSVTVTDVATFVRAATIIANDAVTVTDALVTASVSYIQFDETVTTSEHWSSTGGGDLTTGDGVTITDSPIAFGFTKVIADTVSMSDDASGIAAVVSVSFADTVTMSDSYANGYAPVWADSVTMSDAMSVGDQYWSNVVLMAHGGDGPLNGVNPSIHDNGPNNLTLTAVGAPAQGQVSPYASGGGSLFLDGASAVSMAANAAHNLGTGDFTIECWAKMPTVNKQTLIDTNTNASGAQIVGQYSLYVTNVQGLAFQVATAASSTTTVINGTSGLLVANTWYHFAVVRQGTTVTSYINGVVDKTATFSGQVGQSTGLGSIGQETDNSTQRLTGHIADVRVSNIARYTGAFTPPAAPFVVDANTRLLANFLNAAVVDVARKGDIVTAGAAKLSNAQLKFAAQTSIFVDTAGVVNVSNMDGSLTLAAGDFTWEAWIYVTAIAGSQIIFDGRQTTGSSGCPTLFLNVGVLSFWVSGGPGITGTAVSANAWHHVAVSRVSGVTRMFLDGVQNGSSYSDANNYAGGTYFGVGGVPASSGFGLNGYLYDVRVTKGVGRYTTTFTPPSAQLPDGPSGPLVRTQLLSLSDTVTMSDTPVVSYVWPLNLSDTVTMSDAGGTPFYGISLAFLLVAGGGSGGSAGSGNTDGGGGGGGGGVLQNAADSWAPGTYTITIGPGSAGHTSGPITNGSDSTIVGPGVNYDAVGGGGGGSNATSGNPGGTGGSGGGSNGQNVAPKSTAVAGQGNQGGGTPAGAANGAGGGGAGGPGIDATPSASAPNGNGGPGITSSITGVAVTYAAGGGSGYGTGGGTGRAGTAGDSSAGNGGASTNGTSAPANRGGGGGGAANVGTSGTGGSGVCCVKPGVGANVSATGTFTLINNVNTGWLPVYQFTGNGTLTLGAQAPGYSAVASAASYTVSTDSFTATRSGGAGWQSARSGNAKTTGKFYLEAKCYTGGNPGDGGIGIVRESWTAAGNYPGAAAPSIGVRENGFGSNDGAAWASGAADLTGTDGTWYFVCVDVDNSLVWIKKQGGTNWNNSGTANPATGAGGLALSGSGPVRFAAPTYTTVASEASTVNTGQSAFVGAVPSGFSPWAP